MLLTKPFTVARKNQTDGWFLKNQTDGWFLKNQTDGWFLPLQSLEVLRAPLSTLLGKVTTQVNESIWR